MKLHIRRRLAILRIRLVGAIEVLLGRACFYSNRKYTYHNLSFSQEGEDGVLVRIFERQQKGFYVDIGAHHPQRFSNTYRFYLRGWRGINVDPLPGSKTRFDALRDRDINLEIGVANEPGVLTYFSFEEPALNTFDSEVALSRTSALLERREIPVFPLKQVLSENLPSGEAIDFLSIDVEGLDLAVLRSNDWTKFRPRYVLAEALGMRDVRDVQQTELHAFMENVGYSLYAKTMNTLFFMDNYFSLAGRNP
jgi:FkbM family methyltransferase